MEEILKELLDALRIIGEDHEDVYDSEVREQMSDAISDGFIRPVDSFVLPESFGMYTSAGDQKVRRALAAYIAAANAQEAVDGPFSFHERLAALQNPDVRTDIEGLEFDDFFGWANPDWFDSEGKLIEPGG